jgi:hypothetical protein
LHGGRHTLPIQLYSIYYSQTPQYHPKHTQRYPTSYLQEPPSTPKMALSADCTVLVYELEVARLRDLVNNLTDLSYEIARARIELEHEKALLAIQKKDFHEEMAAAKEAFEHEMAKKEKRFSMKKRKLAKQQKALDVHMVGVNENAILDVLQESFIETEN